MGDVEFHHLFPIHHKIHPEDNHFDESDNHHEHPQRHIEEPKERGNYKMQSQPLNPNLSDMFCCVSGIINDTEN